MSVPDPVEPVQGPGAIRPGESQVQPVRRKVRNPSRRDMEKWLRSQIDHTIYTHGLNPYQGPEQFEGQDFSMERIIAFGRVQALRDAATAFKIDVGQGDIHDDK